MKKLLIGLTLLTSMSAFSYDCTVSTIIESNGPGDTYAGYTYTEKILSSLIENEKGELVGIYSSDDVSSYVNYRYGLYSSRIEIKVIPTVDALELQVRRPNSHYKVFDISMALPTNKFTPKFTIKRNDAVLPALKVECRI
ncbi:MAG: hypothetical protein ACJAS4_002644 [Bacteriovoracaceae bacterium]|jgi:hypothetical protein